MNKKHLRKELELSLVKTIEDLLISINPEGAKNVDEIIFGASRIIAKKFYKSLKIKEDKKEEKKEVKKVEKKASVTKKKAADTTSKSTPKKATKPAAKKAKSKK